ncbi:hypothetical protein HY493_04010 [Candidatus Woesearchaeota archaeon]|nr:hypothetical protein [Candidatus Woesearchaeota archaeon]
MRLIPTIILLVMGSIAVNAQQTIPIQLDIINASCAAGIQLEAPATVGSGTSFAFTPNLTVQRKKFTIEYGATWDDGRIAKKPLNTTNTKPKSFTPRTNQTRTLLLHARLISIDCEDTTSEDDEAEVAIVVVSNDNAPKEMQPSAQEPRIEQKQGTIGAATKATARESKSLASKRWSVWLMVGVVGVLGALLIWRR